MNRKKFVLGSRDQIISQSFKKSSIYLSTFWHTMSSLQLFLGFYLLIAQYLKVIHGNSIQE